MSQNEIIPCWDQGSEQVKELKSAVNSASYCLRAFGSGLLTW